MLSSQASLIKFLVVVGLVRAALVPTKPGPGEVFKVGSDCQIAWNLDTSGTWTSFSLDLMSGSNFVMQPVVNVFKGRDGTKGPATYSFPCPDVTPNSAIYFYQFSQAGAETTWTTRMTIASASGQTTPPANATQPNGQAIPWGIGHLTSGGAETPSTTPTPSAGPSANPNSTALASPPVTPAVTPTTNTSVPSTSNSTVNTTAAITPTTSSNKSSNVFTTPSTSNSAPVKDTSSSGSSTKAPSGSTTSGSSHVERPMILMILLALGSKILI